MACADIRIRIIRGIVGIQIEQTAIEAIGPISTDIQYVRRIELGIIGIFYSLQLHSADDELFT